MDCTANIRGPRCKVKGGREEVWPLPKDVKEAIDNYLKLDRKRREIAHSDGEHSYLIQPHTNYRTLDFAKALSTRMAQKIVKKWADYSRLGDLSPHDLRRTFAKLAHKGRAALEQIQLSLGHASILTTERYLGVRQDLQDAPCDHLGLRLT